MGKKRVLLWVVLLISLMLTGCGYAAPEKAVHQEMELIRKLDEDAIRSFISYEDIRLSQSAPLEGSKETTEAVKLFFKNFKYRIRSSSVSPDEQTAVVYLYITNLDAKLLAEDLCRSMIRSSSALDGSINPGDLASSFSLMKKCLEENKYPLVTTEASVNLTNQDGVWVIQEDEDLENALTGGLTTYLQDPYLLPPEDVLECRLSLFRDFSAQDWKNYLALNDIFNTGSDLADELDTALAEQIADHFDFQIGQVTQDGDNATAQATITSLDLQGILDACRSSLLEYAKTTESIRATDDEINQKTAECLLNALQQNKTSRQNEVSISLLNNGHTWEVYLDHFFADALLGGIDIAIETLYPASGTE